MLSVQGLCVSYGDLTALWGVSFEVKAHELVTIIGPNGAGKTTTLKAVMGLLQPSAGTLIFQEQPLQGQPTYRRVAAGMALVPEGRRIFPVMSVEENLWLGGHVSRARTRQRQRLSWVYELFPILGERRRQLAGSLSGGEQQMLAIGRALMSQPTLLMLDEPSLGLAPLMVDLLYGRMQELKRQGLTILLVEQQVYGALALADRAYVLETGRVIRHGTGAEMLADETITQTYFAL